MIVDRKKVNKYTPRGSMIVHAVQWSGKASCLVGMPMFDDIVCAIHSIDKTGLLQILTDRDRESGEDAITRVRPNFDYIVVDSMGKIDVWTHEYLKENYEPVPEEPVKRESPLHQPETQVGNWTITPADRPDGT